MHILLLGLGLFLVFILVIHLIFRVIKFTIASFLLGLAIVAVIYFFRQYFGIDLIGEIARHV
jgi:hypothetical protein